MAMPGRSFNSEAYRFGYQGSEKDNEISGTGNSYTTFFRQLDPRLGRWFSTDPVSQPWQSPYTSMDNNPINLNDVMGDQTHGDGDPVEGGDPDDWIREDGSKSSDNPFELGEIKIVIEGLKTTSTEDISLSNSLIELGFFKSATIDLLDLL